jgi:hypothetical protein
MINGNAEIKTYCICPVEDASTKKMLTKKEHRFTGALHTHEKYNGTKSFKAYLIKC